MDTRQNATSDGAPDTKPWPGVPNERYYLVRLTTVRGVFYWCGSLSLAPNGWTPTPTDVLVKRYQLPVAAKQVAAEAAELLGRIFPIVQVDVVNHDGEVIYVAPLEIGGNER